MSIQNHSDQTTQGKLTNTLWQLAPDVSALTGLNLSGAFVVKKLFSPDFSAKTAAGVGFTQAFIFRGIDAITEQTKKVFSNEHYQHSLIEAAGLGLKVVVPWNSPSMTESIGIQLSEDQASYLQILTLTSSLALFSMHYFSRFRGTENSPVVRSFEDTDEERLLYQKTTQILPELSRLHFSPQYNMQESTVIYECAMFSSTGNQALIANKLAALQNKQELQEAMAKTLSDFNEDRNPGQKFESGRSQPFVWIEVLVKGFPQVIQDNLREDFEWIQQMQEGLCSQDKVVFAHGNFNKNNIVQNVKGTEVFFINWEHCCMSNRFYDLAKYLLFKDPNEVKSLVQTFCNGIKVPFQEGFKEFLSMRAIVFATVFLNRLNRVGNLEEYFKAHETDYQEYTRSGEDLSHIKYPHSKSEKDLLFKGACLAIRDFRKAAYLADAK